MRVCPKCGKTNQETRKYCIRCGSVLTAPEKRREERKEEKSEAGSETGKVTTAASVAKASAPRSSDTASPVTHDEWVRPSNVSRGRMRATEHSTGKSEMEKAREAFARAEEVGIAEEGPGITETRMLRASEVRELLRQSAAEEAAPPAAPQPLGETLAPGSAPAPTTPRVPPRPRPQVVEEDMLGKKSVFVGSPEGAATSVRPSAGTGGSEFRSSRYEQETEEPSEAPQTPQTQEGGELEFESLQGPSEPVPEAAPEVPAVTDIDHVTTCPKCGSVINIDMYEYPREVYSAMGSARLGQARFLVVQGKYPQGREILRTARALFTKAGDTNGIAQVDRLMDSLAREP